MPIIFLTDTPLSLAFKKLMARLAENAPKGTIVYIAGGMAAHLYTGSRSTGDIDGEFSKRVFIPADLVVPVVMEDGRTENLYIDTNYNPMFALMHEDYQNDSIPLELDIPSLSVRVLSPVDLVVSKIARLSDNDKRDIEDLVLSGLVSSGEIERRAGEAISAYMGNRTFVEYNLRDTLEIARAAELTKTLIGLKPKPPGGTQGWIG